MQRNVRETTPFRLVEKEIAAAKGRPPFEMAAAVEELIDDMLRVSSAGVAAEYDERTIHEALVEALPCCLRMGGDADAGRRVFSVLKSTLSPACLLPDRVSLRCRLFACLAMCLEGAAHNDDADVAEAVLGWKADLTRSASPSIIEQDAKNVMFSMKSPLETFYLFDALMCGSTRVVRVLVLYGADPRRCLSEMFTPNFYENAIPPCSRKVCEEYGWCDACAPHKR